MSCLLAALLLTITGACPQGWYVNGVQRSGVFECRPVLGTSDGDLGEVYEPDDRVMHGVVLCTDSVPVHDGHHVYCLTLAHAAPITE